MPMDIEKLIALVHASPPLWDQKNKHYHNRHVVDRLWNETAAVLNQKTIIVKKKWKSLRDHFRSELKKIPSEHYNNLGPNSSFAKMPQWPHFKSLLFIKEYMKTRKKPDQHQPHFIDKYNSYIGNQDDNSNETNTKYCVQSGSDLFEVEAMSNSQELPEISKELEEVYTTNSSCKGRKQDQNSKSIDDNDDEDIAFFVSLLPHVRNMDPARKLLCRMEIQQSVYNHAYQNGRTVQDAFVRDQNSTFTENILSAPDHMQFDSKEHLFLQLQANNN